MDHAWPVVVSAVDLEYLRSSDYDKDHKANEERIIPEGDETLEDWERRVLGFSKKQWAVELKKAAPDGLLHFGTELLGLALCNPDDGVNILAGDLEERLGGESGHDNEALP